MVSTFYEKYGSHVKIMIFFPSKVKELLKAWVLACSYVNVASKKQFPINAKLIRDL
jgi:hypothetical protein